MGSLTAWDDAARPAAGRLADSVATKVQELRAVEGSTPEALDWPLVQDSVAEYAGAATAAAAASSPAAARRPAPGGPRCAPSSPGR
ncbi:MAG TPA: hypothetical protein VGS06_06730 [Streptosporangiaceae bacterium]|nr:hypothetical protein [Streptosporangiaceae bacterium]